MSDPTQCPFQTGQTSQSRWRLALNVKAQCRASMAVVGLMGPDLARCTAAVRASLSTAFGLKLVV